MQKISKKKIIFFIIFFLISSTFFLFWKYPTKEEKKVLNPLKYQKIIKNINLKKYKSLNEAENFILENNNIYGTLTAIFLAKKYILKNNLDKAFIQLNNSLQYTKEENLKNILKLRIAKIKIQKKENKQAMDILENIPKYNWNNIIENMKGDIFIKKNNKKEALKSWKKSFSFESSNASKEIIKIKINELK